MKNATGTATGTAPSSGTRKSQTIQHRCILRRSWPAIFAILGLSGPVAASEWTDTDTAWQAGYLLLHVADWRQTLNIAKNPDRFYEVNPLIGEHPSESKVNTYMAASAALHTGIAYTLSGKWRRRFQQVTIGMKAGIVGYNYSVGIRLDF